MSEDLARSIISRIVSDARWAAAQARQYPADRDYWHGMRAAHLGTARRLAHQLLGARWCDAVTHRTYLQITGAKPLAQ